MLDDPNVLKILIIVALVAFGILLFMFVRQNSCSNTSPEGMHNIHIPASNDRHFPQGIESSRDNRLGLFQSYMPIDLQSRERKPFIHRRRARRRSRDLARLDEIFQEYENNYDFLDRESDYDEMDDLDYLDRDNHPLTSLDRNFARFLINDNSVQRDNSSNSRRRLRRLVPRAYDSRPELSSCPPCVCPGDSLLASR